MPQAAKVSTPAKAAPKKERKPDNPSGPTKAAASPSSMLHNDHEAAVATAESRAHAFTDGSPILLSRHRRDPSKPETERTLILSSMRFSLNLSV